jgi:hypothetical protein
LGASVLPRGRCSLRRLTATRSYASLTQRQLGATKSISWNQVAISTAPKINGATLAERAHHPHSPADCGGSRRARGWRACVVPDPETKAQTSARRLSLRPFANGRLVSGDVAREAFCSACSPSSSGATIPGTERHPGQTDTRARGTNVHTASDPTPASSARSYHNSSPFSSYRVPHKRHERLTPFT